MFHIAVGVNMMQKDIIDWLNNDPDERTRKELQDLIEAQNHTELEDRFSSRLAFGTAGLRGVVGAGPNRMNRLVIQQTATGLGNYLLEQIEDSAERGVIIGYDGRLDSKQFAYDTASVLTALGIKVYLTHDVAPTPVVAFGIKHLGTAAGVVVTASHNPPEYNGFKVYWENGAQIIPPHDSGIAAKIELASKEALATLSLKEAEQTGSLFWLKESYYQAYRETINSSPLLAASSGTQDLSLSYTAMHGVGAKMAETLLADAGFNKVFSVQSQREPDGHFPTVNFPNPEEPGAMDRVIELAQQHGCDLACANDPDADRFAVAARKPDGSYQMLTGDQVGSLFGHYLLNQTERPSALVGNTIVSSRLLSDIANAAGANYYQTLTGFKWLTNVAMELESAQKPFLFAYEEALGYTVGNQVWDKDGLSALVVFSQLAQALKSQGKTVWDQLESIYRQHGFYLNQQRSIALDPSAPPIGDQLRAAPPAEIGGKAVVVIEDLKTLEREIIGKAKEKIDLPASDVLIYHLEDRSRVIVRPSGTEPKLKCYYEVITKFTDNMSYDQAQSQAKERMATLIQAHQASL